MDKNNFLFFIDLPKVIGKRLDQVRFEMVDGELFINEVYYEDSDDIPEMYLAAREIAKLRRLF